MVNDYLMNMFFKGGDMGARIKSIQYGLISIIEPATSETATINSVDTAKAVVLFLGLSGKVGYVQNADDTHSRVVLTNATTVTASRVGAGRDSSVSFAVIEFESGIKSVQQGVVTLGGASETATINSVDTAKAVVLPCGFTTNITTGLNSEVLSRLTLTNATTITGTRSGASGTTVVGFSVLEFD